MGPKSPSQKLHFIVLVQHAIVLLAGQHCEPVGLVIVEEAVPGLCAILWKQNCLVDLIHIDIVDPCSIIEQGNCASRWKLCQSLVVWHLNLCHCRRRSHTDCHGDCSEKLLREKKKIVFKHIVKFMQQKLFHSKRLSHLIVEHFKLFNSHAAKM